MLEIQLIGNVGNDCQVKESNGNSFAVFSVAHTESYTEKQGVKVEKTQWVNCIINDSKKGVIPYIKKGTKVFVRGRLSTEIYQDKNKVSKIDIRLNVAYIELLSAQNKDTSPTAKNEPQSENNFNSVADDGLPF